MEEVDMEELDLKRARNLENACFQLQKAVKRAKTEMKKNVIRIQLRNTERNLNNLLH